MPIARFFTYLSALAAFALAGTAFAATGGFDPEAATRAYLDTLQGEARESSDAYFEGGYWLILWSTLVAVLSEWILLHFGWSAKFRDLAERITKRRWLVPAIYALPYVIVSSLIVLPWTIYTGFVRERQYGLMNLGFGEWMGEQAIGLVIAIVMLAIFLTIIFAVIRAAPKRWWLIGTAASSVMLLVAVAIAPVFIAPLFNDYTAMEDGPLRDDIIAMAEADNVPADDVFVFDQSRQHDRISANVSGLFGTMRISLNDNLLERTTPEEVKAVMGHEIGHYVLNHVWIIVGIMTLLLGIGFYIASRAIPAVLARHGEKWGVRGIDDPAVMPLLVIIITVYFTALTPVTNTLIRWNESAADIYGLNAAREPDGFARVAMRLSEYRKIEPSALEEFIFFDHPSGRTRVRMAMDWKAENVENPQMVIPATPDGD